MTKEDGGPEIERCDYTSHGPDLSYINAGLPAKLFVEKCYFVGKDGVEVIMDKPKACPFCGSIPLPEPGKSGPREVPIFIVNHIRGCYRYEFTDILDEHNIAKWNRRIK